MKKLLDLVLNENTIIMKLNRGIIESGNNEGLVSCVASMYKLNNELYRESTFIENQKVLGASTENTFNICYQIELKNALVLAGYFKEKMNSDEYTFQLIKGFEARKYDAHNSEYELGDVIVINVKTDLHFIESITYQ
jgi:hypothetical protein